MPAVRRLLLAVVLLPLLLAAPAAAHFPQSAVVAIPSPGDATVTSSALPASTKSATITVRPATPADKDIFAGLSEILSTAPTRGGRVLTCVALYLSLKQIFGEDEDFLQSNTSLQLLFLAACVQLALHISQPPGGARAAARSAAAGCPRQNIAIAMHVTHSGGQYHAQVQGKTAKPRGRSPLVVSCRRHGSALQIRLRARKRGTRLRKVVGPKLGIGFYNPSTGRPVHVRTTFAAR